MIDTAAAVERDCYERVFYSTELGSVELCCVRWCVVLSLSLLRDLLLFDVRFCYADRQDCVCTICRNDQRTMCPVVGVGWRR